MTRQNSTPRARLKIVHINDLHGHVARLTAQGAQPIFSRMAGRLALLRAAAEREGGGVLALSGGDDCVGSPFDLLLGEGDSAAFHAHAAYRLYSAVGLNACAIGNHDLDWGEAALARSLRANATFPALSANLTGLSELASLCRPAEIFSVCGVRVAVIGVTTPSQIAALPGSTLAVADPIAALLDLLPALMDASDVRIVLSHLGYSMASTSVAGASDVELARSLPPGAVHLIVGAHTHHALHPHGLDTAHIVNGITIVQAGCNGDFMGEVDLVVEGGRVTVTNAALIPTASLPIDEDFETRYVQPLAKDTQRRMNETLRHVSVPLTGAALGRFIADGVAARCRLAGYPVDCAAVDGSCMAADLKAGPLTQGDLLAIMPYADTIQLIRLSGRQLYALARESHNRKQRKEDEEGLLYFSSEVDSLAAFGAGFTRALAAPTPATPTAQQMEREFILACTSFMARVSQPSLAQAGGNETGLFVRRELAAFLRSQKGCP